jgi:DNA-binding XRE family transcriptional regulator
MNQNPDNHLRTHRKQSGFNQQEMGAILGCDAGAVSKFEWSHRLPPLQLALALEVVFMVPVSELFSGLSEAVRNPIEKRLSEMEAALGSRSGRGPRAAVTAKKLEWLMERSRTRTAV